MIVVKVRRDSKSGEDRQRAKRIFALGEATANRDKQSNSLGAEYRDDRERQEADDEQLLFGRQQRDHIDRRKRERRGARQQGSSRLLLRTSHLFKPAR